MAPWTPHYDTLEPDQQEFQDQLKKEIREDERVGMLTLAWFARPKSFRNIGPDSVGCVVALIVQMLLVWAVGTEFSHGNVMAYSIQMAIGRSYVLSYRNASDVLRVVDSDGAFWANISIPQGGVSAGMDMPSSWLTYAISMGSPVNTGPLTDKTMTLRGISIRLWWAGTLMAGFADASDCAGDSPLPLKMAIIAVIALYLARSGGRLVSAIRPTSGVRGVIKNLLKTSTIIAWYSTR